MQGPIFTTSTIAAGIVAALTLTPLAAQTPCADGDNWGDRNRASHCEVREYTIADTGRLTVDSSMNGGIRVTGADRANVLVRAKVQTKSLSPEGAVSLATQVRVQAVPGSIRADGPEMNRDRNWSVSYEILVPRRSGLNLKAHNGGISIAEVEGDISFETTNGGVTLNRLGGDVRGRTVNGGVKVELTGNTWRGNQLEVETTNGGIHVKVPEYYSARLESSTVNGGFHTDLPGVDLTRSKADRRISLTLGSGGPLVRLQTTNGGVHLSKT